VRSGIKEKLVEGKILMNLTYTPGALQGIGVRGEVGEEAVGGNIGGEVWNR